MTLNSKQQAVTTSTAPVVVVQAPPGCGKSHVAREIATLVSNQGGSVAILAFNVAIAKDLALSLGLDPTMVEGSARNGITVLNFDKLTSRSVDKTGKKLGGKFYALGGTKRDTGYLAKALGVECIPVGEGTMSIGNVCGKIESTYANYCNSGDEQLTHWHAPSICDDEKTDKSIRQQIADYAKALGMLIDKADGKIVKFPLVSLSVKFAHIKKHWAINGYPVPGDTVIIDEAQDLPRLFLKAIPIWVSEGKRVILCGDKYQELYAWAGAHNAMQHAVDHCQGVQFALTDSYRFGPTIANMASRIIDPLAGPDSVIGVADDVTDDGRLADMYLYPTNTEVIGTVIRLQGICKVPDSLADEIIANVTDIAKLQLGERATGPLSFHNWGSLSKAIRDDDRFSDLKKIIAMMETYGSADLLDMVRRAKGSKTGPTVSTIHRIKGMEADTVEVTLPAGQVSKETGLPPAPTDVERMLAYVAVTRAKHIVRVNNLERFLM